MNSKGKIKTRPFVSAEFLDTPEAIAAYLVDALNSGSSGEFKGALNVVARAGGMTEITTAKIRSKPRARDDHGPNAKTPARRIVFRDLFPAEEAAELEIRSTLLNGLKHWLASRGMTQAKAAQVLGITQARVSDIKRGKIDQFSLELLIRLAARAGLQPKLRLAA
jgi:predicted XRE-type DNA-binding protein